MLAAVTHDQWGRLLALLVAQYRRLDLAEDGLGDAFEATVRRWPVDGVPDNPAAWLLTAARRRVLDRLRAEAVAVRTLPLLAVEADLTEEAQRTMAGTGDRVLDERLRLVLLCAHPALAREAAAALTLRLVMGVSTEDVARLFLVSTPTMAARLTRARNRLAGHPFLVPTGAELAARVAVVAAVSYLAFTAGYAPGSGADVLRADVAPEAIRLVRVLRAVLPAPVEPATARELDALLALMLLQHARRDARVATHRSLVLLPDQDRARWHHEETAEALHLLAAQVTAPGTPYLLQALIAAEHAVAPTSAATSWSRIVARYDELLAIDPSPVVRLNRAVALAEA
ncbi:MAG: RNA polymerase subunit sigma-24, partial [Nocardioides sp.]|nr:RNA polymerase subunit sigma-24 [Nocardioides sp.]